MWDTLFQQGRERLLRQCEVPLVYAGRGFSLEHMHILGLGLDEQGNGLIPLRSRTGALTGFKVRHIEPEPDRYSEIPPKHGNPPWIAPDLLEAAFQPEGFLWVEGELNAMISWLALRGENWGVCGLGSAFGPLDWNWMARAGLPIAFYLDRGRVGDKTARDWLEQAARLEIKMARLEPLLGNWDACEYAEACGLEALRERWQKMLRALERQK